MTDSHPIIPGIEETPRVSDVDSKNTANGMLKPQKRMSHKGNHIMNILTLKVRKYLCFHYKHNTLLSFD